ncbi:MAG: glycosyltransferase [Parvularculaceae bacterium]
MTAPKILQICTNFPPGGIQRHVLDVGYWLRERNWCVGFAGSPGAWMDETKDTKFHNIALSDVAVEGGALPRRLLAAHGAARRLRAVLKQEQYDLIHAHESAPALVARLASFGLKTPIALTFRSREPGRVKNSD